MIPGIPGGGSVSASSSATSDVRQTGGGINVGGINTGVQGLDLQTLLIVAGIGALAAWFFNRK